MDATSKRLIRLAEKELEEARELNFFSVEFLKGYAAAIRDLKLNANEKPPR